MKFASSNTSNKFISSGWLNKFITNSRIIKIFRCNEPTVTDWWAKWKNLMSFIWTGLNYQQYLISSFLDRRKITITNRDFITNYIPESSTAIFKLQADTDFIADDTDNLWFDGAGNQKSVTNADLYDNDYGRTAIKCSHTAPYDVTAVGLIKNTVILTADQNNKLHEDFELWIFWSGVWSDYGHFKDNRLMP